VQPSHATRTLANPRNALQVAPSDGELGHARPHAFPMPFPIHPLENGVEQEVQSKNAKRQKHDERHIATIPIGTNNLKE
jgi:hypothetical protein